MTITTKTYTLAHNPEVIPKVHEYLSNELSQKDLDDYLKYIGRWIAVSFWFKESKKIIGFAAAEYFQNGARLMTRMYKGKEIRHNSKVNMQKDTYEIVYDQYKIAKSLNVDYVFMSRENNPKSFINYNNQLDFTDWNIEEDRYLTGNGETYKSSWQYVMWSPVTAGAQLDLKAISKEEWNETFAN
tara:strand:+ start:2104 stop:2658 length:555 start_codon:yes stop_codon:yes gene_type:complete